NSACSRHGNARARSIPGPVGDAGERYRGVQRNREPGHPADQLDAYYDAIRPKAAKAAAVYYHLSVSGLVKVNSPLSWRGEMQYIQKSYKLIAAVAAGIAGIASGLHAASAQDAAAPGGYQFFVTPYLWLASVHATTLTPLAREPEVNSNVSTIDLLSHLDGAP